MEHITLYLFYFLVFITAINIFFYAFYLVFAFAKAKKNIPQFLPPVSVIVCAKNEQHNLSKNIPKLLQQEYPKFEIILINDASLDNTEEIMEALESAHKNVEYVKVVNNERFWGNKKYALTLGIKRAKYNHLLFIDADCYPASNQWIKSMASSFDEKKEMVLGYGAYEKKGGSFLNKLIRFETVMTAVQYFSYAMNGRPYMGVGRNLAYTLPLFFKHKGFSSHLHVLSGDDDLFINEAATSTNTGVQFFPQAFTISAPKESFGDWIIQKRRHVTTATHYKWLDKSMLGLFYTSQLLFLILATLLIVLQWRWQWVVSVIGIRYLIAWTSVGTSAYKLKEKDVAWLFPVLELFLVIIQLSVFFLNKFSKPTLWK